MKLIDLCATEICVIHALVKHNTELLPIIAAGELPYINNFWPMGAVKWQDVPWQLWVDDQIWAWLLQNKSQCNGCANETTNKLNATGEMVKVHACNHMDLQMPSSLTAFTIIRHGIIWWYKTHFVYDTSEIVSVQLS